MATATVLLLLVLASTSVARASRTEPTKEAANNTNNLQMPPVTNRGIYAGLLPTSFFLATGLALCCTGLVGWLLFWRRRRSSHPAAVQLNEQGIVDSLTEQNLRRLWASRRSAEAALYLVHVQDVGGIGLPRSLVVKKLQNSSGTVDGNLVDRCQSEVNLLAGIHHDNIINLVHFIRRDDAVMLVYDYVENGSLHHWLHLPPPADGSSRRRPLSSWPTRRAIAMGVAKGLCHMHHGCRNTIVHHNINSSNILLDRDFKPKIASFGLAQVYLPGLHQPLLMSEIPAGNFGYTAPEFASMAGEKSDVYSYGVVLLELVTGRVANGDGADGHLANWARNCQVTTTVVDMAISDGQRYLKEMAAAFRLGVDCTSEDPKERPTMRKVVRRLRRRTWTNLLSHSHLIDA